MALEVPRFSKSLPAGHKDFDGRLKALGLKTTGSKAELEARYEASTGDGLHHSFGPSLYEGSGYKDHTLLRLLIRYILDYNWGYLRVIYQPAGSCL